MREPGRIPLVALALGLLLTSPGVTAEPFDDLGTRYERQVQPILKRHCFTCHSADKSEGELILDRFTSLSEIRREPSAWQRVAEMLDNGEMPPRDAEPLADQQRKQLLEWTRSYLDAEARDRAGDPGRVVLRRLSNAEYTYTLRDLTGIDGLEPAREFPVDGAAGEGFTNTGNALVMSPALLAKYLEAAKQVANHLVLLPEGVRFSPHTTQRDQTDEILQQIRDFYREFTDPTGGDRVNLQGIVFDTNAGGRLPLEKYLAATLIERESLAAGSKSIADVATEHQLNAKYLNTLCQSLTSSAPSLLLDDLRTRWRQAQPQDTAALVTEIAAWQQGLWRFTTVGHIGKQGGPQAWLEPVTPLVERQELRHAIPAEPSDKIVTFSLIATDAGDGNESDFVVWQRPRLVKPGRPDLLLRDVRQTYAALIARRAEMLAKTTDYLRASEEIVRSQDAINVENVAAQHNVDVEGLKAWLSYLGVGATTNKIEGHFANQIVNAAGYDFVHGWGNLQTPLLLTNASDQQVRIPGLMKPHSVVIHPSPTQRAVVGWRSPRSETMTIEATVTDAHPECGNGVAWALELRRGNSRQRLAVGHTQGGTPNQLGPFQKLQIAAGDVVALSIGPRDGNHVCDLTEIDLRIVSHDNDGQTWQLAKDVSGDVLAGNPRADQYGHADVWHFFVESEQAAAPADAIIPQDSLLARWFHVGSVERRTLLVAELHNLLTDAVPRSKNSPDDLLYQQLTALDGPLLRHWRDSQASSTTSPTPAVEQSALGVDPSLFGKHPRGDRRDAEDLCFQAPHVITMQLPADLVAGWELVTTAELDRETGFEGSIQVGVASGAVSREARLSPSAVQVVATPGPWTASQRTLAYSAPILVRETSHSRTRIEAALREFRELFPAALCYTKIVPVDEVVTLTLFYREDDHLVRLMLDDAQRARLDRLWDELHFVSHDAVTLVDAFEQLMEFATQDADPKVFEPLRQPIHDNAAAFQRRLVESEPRHLAALLELAELAFRRPLSDAESTELRDLYHRLRQQDLAHEQAIQLTLARVLVSPAFLYRLEQPGPGAKSQPVSDWELASRLSYFLWSSQPDGELRSVAAAGQLRDDGALLAQTRRMLADPRARRLAIEFACQWLHIRDFDKRDEKSERHFPTFAGLREAMYEESIQFFADLFQNDRSVLDILDADHTFLNEDLAKHYAIPGVTGTAWRRVEGVQQFSRGGILAQATTLATQSGASRTSPILRGNWISEVLLGERLPRPPKDVSQLPEDDATTANLTMRQLVELHTNDLKCAVCHQRIDPLGFALEGFDAIGRYRDREVDDQPIDTQARAPDGAQFEGLDGLRKYLLNERREAFLRQFNRKLLGFALGRAVQLSDEPLLSKMRDELSDQDYRFRAALEAIVLSPQFREIRGRETAFDD